MSSSPSAATSTTKCRCTAATRSCVMIGVKASMS
ncbi:Uncharacterised protein [Mycobacteroides abscessus subsp. abscessus]|nr:Uncharacterised protein [Mycobacteroides abscessus subsp. abscessus]